MLLKPIDGSCRSCHTDCHKKETGTFPAGAGTAIRFRVGTTCVACHAK